MRPTSCVSPALAPTGAKAPELIVSQLPPRGRCSRRAGDRREPSKISVRRSGGGPEVLIYSRAPIASTGRARSARLAGSARAKSARSAEMPRIAANGLAGMYGRPPLSAWLSGSSAVAIARPMPSPIRRVVRSSLLLRSVQVAWGISLGPPPAPVIARRARLRSSSAQIFAARASVEGQRRVYAPGVTSPLSYARTTA